MPIPTSSQSSSSTSKKDKKSKSKSSKADKKKDKKKDKKAKEKPTRESPTPVNMMVGGIPVAPGSVNDLRSQAIHERTARARYGTTEKTAKPKETPTNLKSPNFELIFSEHLFGLLSVERYTIDIRILRKKTVTEYSKNVLLYVEFQNRTAGKHPPGNGFFRLRNP